MNKGDAVNIVAYRLGNRTDLDTRIAQEMSLLQETELERGASMAWWLLSEDQYIDTTVGEERLPLPSSFLREYEFGALWYYDSTATVAWTQLHKDTDRRTRSNLGYTYDATGKPQYYSLTGSYWRLRPVPDAVYRIYTKVYTADTAPSALGDAETNGWLTNAPDLLIAGTLVKMARELRLRREATTNFETDYKLAMDRFQRDMVARRQANLNRQMGR